ncbi:hypothetical protein [Bacillus sp. B15-48]|uniref:hypothetical protein n=1 Tax=Bacillus sp. B15-48 TaxID=1548601 RepID=UPI00193F2BFB|nr:hypothetical protein [Bacillus sp. B15-48]MBM4764262.1 hypothetical protein [Bacillus sp. B15-48]
MGEDSKNKMPFTIYINGKAYPSSDESQPLSEEQVNKVLNTVNSNMNGVMGILSENLGNLPVIGKIFEGQRVFPKIETNIENGTLKLTVNGHHLLDIDLQDIHYTGSGEGTEED